jgi:hypothetical protein
MKNVINISKPNAKALQFIKEHIAQKQETKAKIVELVKSVCAPQAKRRVSVK